ncbi:MAG: hypothetical protein CM1200mP18_21720 [Gammaproteobacteria bacterium]|nr:MAG: hypothetical protein CM1200mP18_21720 [Gammaproteobacteria bacterium]
MSRDNFVAAVILYGRQDRLFQLPCCSPGCCGETMMTNPANKPRRHFLVGRVPALLSWGSRRGKTRRPLGLGKKKKMSLRRTKPLGASGFIQTRGTTGFRPVCRLVKRGTHFQDQQKAGGPPMDP